MKSILPLSIAMIMNSEMRHCDQSLGYPILTLTQWALFSTTHVITGFKPGTLMTLLVDLISRFSLLPFQKKEDFLFTNK